MRKRTRTARRIVTLVVAGSIGSTLAPAAAWAEPICQEALAEERRIFVCVEVQTDPLHDARVEVSGGFVNYPYAHATVNPEHRPATWASVCVSLNDQGDSICLLPEL
jgi:hypothetical protein